MRELQCVGTNNRSHICPTHMRAGLLRGPQTAPESKGRPVTGLGKGPEPEPTTALGAGAEASSVTAPL